MSKYVLDSPPKKIWSLNQLKIGEYFVGVPSAEYYKNKKGNQFIKLMLDAGYSTCSIFFLIFEYPEQRLLNSKFHNSFELVRFYREVNEQGVDEGISQLHDINWEAIIDWLNNLHVLKIQVISQNQGGFKNIKFVSFTDKKIYDYINRCKWRILIEVIKHVNKDLYGIIDIMKMENKKLLEVFLLKN